MQYDKIINLFKYTGRFNVGQNLAMGHSDWSSAMQGWEDEKADYDYTSNTSPTGKVVGHYTQVKVAIYG